MDILNEFGINYLLLAAQVVNFFILLFILKRFLYQPILKVLENRRKTIEQSLKNASEIEKKLLQTEEEREKVLAEAQVEVEKMLSEAKKEIAIMKDEGRVQAEELASQIIKKGEESAKAEMERMRQEFMGSMAEIVGMAMEKVTRGTFDKKKQKEIIEKEVRNLS